LDDRDELPAPRRVARCAAGFFQPGRAAGRTGRQRAHDPPGRAGGGRLLPFPGVVVGAASYQPCVKIPRGRINRTERNPMKTFLKVIGGVLLLILALAAGGLTWLSLKKPAARAASAERIETTPARLERGKYLVEHVTNCIDCHSDHSTAYGFPIKPGTEG